ncbi:MAG: oxidoreductase, partial [Acidimicrobiales bacterium]|nr:oxidoreductase [Acidimicrobiales bacterium]
PRSTTRRAGPAGPARHGRPERPGRPAASPLSAVDLLAFVGVNLALIAGMWVRHGNTEQLTSTAGWLTAGGQLAGLYGAFAILGQLVLISRVPWLERRYGMDTLNHWHRWTGFAAVWMLVGHVVLITFGYAFGNQVSVAHQINEFVFHYPDLLMAIVGFVAIIGVAATSIRAARRSLRYETWWFVHLYAYLGIALAFSHQIANGADFIDDPLARAYWVLLYLGAAALVLGWRWIEPAYRAVRHQLRVVDVVPEARGVVTIVLSGRALDALAAAGGQFFLLRFLRADRWYKAHPFSLSAAPDGRTLRFTVKALGDDSASLQAIPIGTRVMAEGPYGAFTAAKASRRKVALIGGGIGITPVRAIFEDIDRGPGDVTLLYRARNRDEAVFHDDLVAIGARRGFDLKISYSRPHGRSVGTDPFHPAHLVAAMPDIADRDVFVCGPPSLLSAVASGLRKAGVPHDQIHLERFDY